MKKIILFLSLCMLGFFNQSSAQALQLKVTNKTRCTVFYRVLCNYQPSCKPGLESILIVLNAGATVTYNAGTVPYLPAAVPAFVNGDFINGALVYNAMPYCSNLTMYPIGEQCSGYPDNVSYQVYETSAFCKICEEKLIKAQWTPGDASGMAELVFAN